MASVITQVVEVPAAQPQLPKSTPTTPTFPDSTWSLFPPPARKPRSRSVKMPSRKPLPTTEPVPALPGLNTSATHRRSASVETSRGRACSSEDQPSTPDLTDDSDASQDDERDQISMTEFMHTYYDMSTATRYTNQEFLSAPVKPARPVGIAHDRIWATDVATTLEAAIPITQAVHAVDLESHEHQIMKSRITRDLNQSRSFSNLKQRSPARRRIPRNHPDVLSTIQIQKFALSALPHSAPLPTSTRQQEQLHSPTRTYATFETWPPRTSSSVSVPTVSSTPRTAPSAAPTVPLPPLPRPSMRPRANTDLTSRPAPTVEAIPPVPALEKSFWEHDDDEELFPTKKGHNKGKESLSKMFQHARNLSSGSAKETVPIVASIELPVTDNKKKNKKTAAEVWRTMFGIGLKKPVNGPASGAPMLGF